MAHSLAHNYDRLDLTSVLHILWQGKLHITCMTAAAILCTAIYIFFIAQPRYEAAVYLDEPFAGSLTVLNEGRTLRLQQDDATDLATNLKPYTPKDIFSYTQRFLGSDTIKQQQIQYAVGASTDTPLLAGTIEANDWRIQITPPTPKGRQLYRISIYANSQQAALDDLSHYLELLRRHSIDTLQDSNKSDIQLTIDNIQRTLKEQRAVARDERLDQISRLEEALQIARSANLQQPQFTIVQPPEQDSLRPYIDGSALYARGIQALEAELSILSQRQNDDAHIKNLREYEAQLRLLQNMQMDVPASFLPYRLDGEIHVSDRPINPKKSLLLTLGLILGLVAGITLVLGKHLLQGKNA